MSSSSIPEALEFFKSSRSLLTKHDPYLEKYTYSLVLESKVKQAINEIKQNSDKSNSRFFEARLMLAIDSLKRKDFKKPNETIFIPQGSVHRIQNNYRTNLKIIEAQVGAILKETDIVRFQDIYGRVK